MEKERVEHTGQRFERCVEHKEIKTFETPISIFSFLKPRGNDNNLSLMADVV